MTHLSANSNKTFSDKELLSMNFDEIKKLVSKEKKYLKKDYEELEKKRKLIEKYRKLQEYRQKIKEGKVIKNKTKVDSKKLSKNKTKVEPKVHSKRIKTFEDYFEECIKNKKIPKDTPSYLRKALERVIKEYDQGIKIEKSSLNGFAKKYFIINKEPTDLPSVFFEKNYNNIMDFFINNKNIKIKFILSCIFLKKELIKGKKVEKELEFDLHSYFYINLKSSNEEELINKMIRFILDEIDSVQDNGSGYEFKEVKKLEIYSVDYKPIKGSSYIPLPDWLMRKKAIVSIRNKDNKCFIWSVLRYLHPREKNDSRLSDLKEYEFSLNTKGITFPIKVKDITKFENLNPDLPGINVFSVDEKNIYPLREVKKDCKNTIDLFLYEKDGKFHYSLIKNFSRLVRSQLTKRTNDPIHICKRCFCYFTKEELLDNHIKYCLNNKSSIFKMPESNKFLHFKNYQKQLPIPFVVYADFECFTKPIKSCCPNPTDSYNYNYQKHEPSGFCCFSKGIVPGINIKPIIYTKSSEDEDVAKVFVEKIIELTKGIYNDFYLRPKPLKLSIDEQKFFKEATICHICNQKLEKDKVRDHCHFTGKYRGAAHNKCNLICKKPKVLPVIFHNLQGYDAHLFIKQLAKIDGELNCIPSTEEKYISFSKHIKVGEYKDISGYVKPITFEIRFIDSFKFMQSSLANLVSNLSPDDFHNIKHAFKSNAELLIRKGVFPYDYVSSIDKLKEKQLPPKEGFYSKLNDEYISDEDYQHAINVWNKMGCKTIRDYHNLYLKSDVLLLADVFEKFRKTCLQNYKLDPAHYYTSPGLAWDACLKTTGKKLELLHDYDMLMMIENGIRGGISHISKRYAEANNKYMKIYNSDKKSSYIQYLDANNLYGWAMTQNLPTHGFKWMNDITMEKVIDILDKKNYSMINNKSKGYIFEVDLEYPQHLWSKHNDYPLAPEKLVVDGVEKLICHFKPRKNYVIHYRALRQCLELGMKITKVHRGIVFKQSPWMEPYIKKNTELRMRASNNFEKDFFKLMNNSVFGKTIENIRKRQNIKLVDNRKIALKLSNQPNFDRCTIFDKNLIAVHMKNTEVYFNKPVYVGQSILDLSKTLMFDFHYNYIKEKYGKKAKLLFTDTDSLMYHIYTDDFYKDISDDVLDKFDTSDYTFNHPSGILTGVNKKVIGMFKDEAAGRQITHFVGLRPKLYCYKVEDQLELKKCKGIKKNVVKKKIDFDDYLKCLFTGEKQMRSMNIIKSDKHDIYSKEVNKIALSNEDNKRIVLKDKINTLALR